MKNIHNSISDDYGKNNREDSFGDREEPLHKPQKSPTNRVYICGPMTGIPHHNREAFNRAEDAIRRAGYDPVNPSSNGLSDDATWTEHMRANVRLLTTCDEVTILPGWQNSKGALLEINIAKTLGLHLSHIEKYIPLCSLGEYEQ